MTSLTNNMIAETLNLSHNSLVGNVPSQVCKLRHNDIGLEEFIVDCNPTKTSDQLVCADNCCTDCTP